MDFDKYRKRGDYHWREYARTESAYRKYVDGLSAWVVGRGPLLDVGAGDGLITHVLRHKESRGIEFDATAVKLAQGHGLDVIEGDACALPFGDRSFRIVFMGDVIEHLPEPVPAVAEARRVLRDGGHFYVTTPPRREPIRPYHFREYTPHDLLGEITPHGFKLAEPMFERHERIHAHFVAD